MRSQPSSQSYLLRMQGFLRPVHTDSGSDNTLETAENGGQPSESQSRHVSVEPEQ